MDPVAATPETLGPATVISLPLFTDPTLAVHPLMVAELVPHEAVSGKMVTVVLGEPEQVLFPVAVPTHAAYSGFEW
jgi:hypothetical protein